MMRQTTVGAVKTTLPEFKVAISDSAGAFHRYAIDYCRKHAIDHVVVDFMSADLMSKIADCTAVFWHWNASDKFALQILSALEIAGFTVFPDFRTSWSFDNKLSQALLFNVVNAPTPKTHVFFRKDEALRWAETAELPVIWKLSTGAGSQNVKMLESRSELVRFIRKSFNAGFWTYRRRYILKWRIDQFRRGQVGFKRVAAALYRLAVLPSYIREAGKERDYFIAQEFISGNDGDVRIVVIGDRAFGIVRKNRENDFRASASGLIFHDPALIDPKFVTLAFDLTEKLGAQCLAFDFLERANGDPVLLEICYGFTPEGYFQCPGYWSKDLTWVAGEIDPYGWMIELLRSDSEGRSSRWLPAEERTFG